MYMSISFVRRTELVGIVNNIKRLAEKSNPLASNIYIGKQISYRKLNYCFHV